MRIEGPNNLQDAVSVRATMFQVPGTATPLLKAIEAVGDDPSLLQELVDAEIAQLKAGKDELPPAPEQEQIIQQAAQILSTVKVSASGIELTIPKPAGLSACDAEVIAMNILNIYFRKKYPEFNCDAIKAHDLLWYIQQEGVEGRDLDSVHEIKIVVQPTVQGTTSKYRGDQQIVLAEKDLGFAAPRDVALVAAAVACHNPDEDALNGLWVRTSAPGVVLINTHSPCVRVIEMDGCALNLIAAAGAPLSI